MSECQEPARIAVTISIDEEVPDPQVLVLLVLIVVEVHRRHQDCREAECFDEWGNRDSAAERSQLNRRPAIDPRHAGDDALTCGSLGEVRKAFVGDSETTIAASFERGAVGI